AEKTLREILEEAGAGDPDFVAEVRASISREPFEIAEDAEIVAIVRRHAAAVSGAEPESVGLSFWADPALLSSAGMPTVLFGPRGEGAHAAVEWVDVADLERCVEVYVAVAWGLCC